MGAAAGEEELGGLLGVDEWERDAVDSDEVEDTLVVEVRVVLLSRGVRVAEECVVVSGVTSVVVPGAAISDAGGAAGGTTRTKLARASMELFPGVVGSSMFLSTTVWIPGASNVCRNKRTCGHDVSERAEHESAGRNAQVELCRSWLARAVPRRR